MFRKVKINFIGQIFIDTKEFYKKREIIGQLYSIRCKSLKNDDTGLIIGYVTGENISKFNLILQEAYSYFDLYPEVWIDFNKTEGYITDHSRIKAIQIRKRNWFSIFFGIF